MDAKTLETQMLDFLRIVHEAQELEDLTPGNPMYAIIKELQTLFASSVEFLRSKFPNPAVQRLAKVVWEAVRLKITPVMYGPKVASLTFIQDGTASRALIVVPENWGDMIRRDPITQVGAVVFVGSQAVDYASDHYDSQENVKLRASAYEAEYLNTIRNIAPTWELTDYHQQVLREFPEGLATPRVRKVIYQIQPLIEA